jgi:hypothetical protein
VRFFGSTVVVPDTSGNSTVSLQSTVPLSRVGNIVQVFGVHGQQADNTEVQGKPIPVISLSDSIHVVINLNGYDSGDYELVFNVFREPEGDKPEPAKKVRVRLVTKPKG